MPDIFDTLVEEQIKPKRDVFDDLVDEQEKPREFFGLGDTFSALSRVPEAVVTTVPAAVQKMYRGLDMPESSPILDREAEFQKSVQEDQARREASGEATSVGSAIREALPSLGFSLGGIVPAIAGSFVGSKLGGAKGGTAGAMAASGLTSYRMAGADFLNRSMESLEARKGAPLDENERQRAYEEFLPLAQNSALWEAGPEAVSNALMLKAGKFVFNFGNKTGVAPSLAKRAVVGTGAVGAEIASEGETALGQYKPEMAAQQYVQTGSTEGAPTEYPGGRAQAYKDVTPATLALMGMGAATAGGVKLATLPFQQKPADSPQQGPENFDPPPPPPPGQDPDEDPNIGITDEDRQEIEQELQRRKQAAVEAVEKVAQDAEDSGVLPETARALREQAQVTRATPTPKPVDDPNQSAAAKAPFITEVAKTFAQDRGVEISQVPANQFGRVTKKDVEKFLKSQPTQKPPTNETQPPNQPVTTGTATPTPDIEQPSATVPPQPEGVLPVLPTETQVTPPTGENVPPVQGDKVAGSQGATTIRQVPEGAETYVNSDTGELNYWDNALDDWVPTGQFPEGNKTPPPTTPVEPAAPVAKAATPPAQAAPVAEPINPGDLTFFDLKRRKTGIKFKGAEAGFFTQDQDGRLKDIQIADGSNSAAITKALLNDFSELNLALRGDASIPVSQLNKKSVDLLSAFGTLDLDPNGDGVLTLAEPQMEIPAEAPAPVVSEKRVRGSKKAPIIGETPQTSPIVGSQAPQVAPVEPAAEIAPPIVPEPFTPPGYSQKRPGDNPKMIFTAPQKGIAVPLDKVEEAVNDFDRTRVREFLAKANRGDESLGAEGLVPPTVKNYSLNNAVTVGLRDKGQGRVSSISRYSGQIENRDLRDLAVLQSLVEGRPTVTFIKKAGGPDRLFEIRTGAQSNNLAFLADQFRNAGILEPVFELDPVTDGEDKFLYNQVRVYVVSQGGRIPTEVVNEFAKTNNYELIVRTGISETIGGTRQQLGDSLRTSYQDRIQADDYRGRRAGILHPADYLWELARERGVDLGERPYSLVDVEQAKRGTAVSQLQKSKQGLEKAYSMVGPLKREEMDFRLTWAYNAINRALGIERPKLIFDDPETGKPFKKLSEVIKGAVESGKPFPAYSGYPAAIREYFSQVAYETALVKLAETSRGITKDKRGTTAAEAAKAEVKAQIDELKSAFSGKPTKEQAQALKQLQKKLQEVSKQIDPWSLDREKLEVWAIKLLENVRTNYETIRKNRQREGLEEVSYGDTEDATKPNKYAGQGEDTEGGRLLSFEEVAGDTQRDALGLFLKEREQLYDNIRDSRIPMVDRLALAKMAIDNGVFSRGELGGLGPVVADFYDRVSGEDIKKQLESKEINETRRRMLQNTLDNLKRPVSVAKELSESYTLEQLFNNEHRNELGQLKDGYLNKLLQEIDNTIGSQWDALSSGGLRFRSGDIDEIFARNTGPKLVRATDAKQLLEGLLKSNVGKQDAKLLRTLLQNSKVLEQIPVNFYDYLSGNPYGQYNRFTGEIDLNLEKVGEGGDMETSVHEVSHSLLEYFLEPSNKNLLNARQRKLVGDLNNLYSQTRKMVSEKGLFEGNPELQEQFSNINEWTAAVMSNPQFRGVLQEMSLRDTVTGKMRSAWEAFKDFVAKIFGIDRSIYAKSFDKVLELSLDSGAGFLSDSPGVRNRGESRWNELTADLQGRDLTQADLDAWKKANPEKYAELEKMREAALKAAGYATEGWHYTKAGAKDFTTFSRESSDMGAFFFSPTNINVSGRPDAQLKGKFFLSLKNPRRVTSTKSVAGVDSPYAYYSSEELTSRGFDGIVGVEPTANGGMRAAEYLVFNPNQIKSAEPLNLENGRLVPPTEWAQPENPDIRFRKDNSNAPQRPVRGEDRVSGTSENFSSNIPADERVEYLSQTVGQAYSVARQWVDNGGRLQDLFDRTQTNLTEPEVLQAASILGNKAAGLKAQLSKKPNLTAAEIVALHRAEDEAKQADKFIVRMSSEAGQILGHKQHLDPVTRINVDSVIKAFLGGKTPEELLVDNRVNIQTMIQGLSDIRAEAAQATINVSKTSLESAGFNAEELQTLQSLLSHPSATYKQLKNALATLGATRSGAENAALAERLFRLFSASTSSLAKSKLPQLVVDTYSGKGAKPATDRFLAKMEEFLKLGKFNEDDVSNTLLQSLGLTGFDANFIKSIRADVERVAATPEGDLRNQASVDVLKKVRSKFYAQILNDFGGTMANTENRKHVYNMLTAMWQAGVLSGPPTAMVNLVGSAASVGTESLMTSIGYASKTGDIRYFADIVSGFLSAFVGNKSTGLPSSAMAEVKSALTGSGTRYRNMLLDEAPQLENIDMNQLTGPIKYLAGYGGALKWVGRVLSGLDAINMTAADEAMQRMAMRFFISQEKGVTRTETNRIIQDLFDPDERVVSEQRLQAEREVKEFFGDRSAKEQQRYVAKRTRELLALRREEILPGIREIGKDTAQRFTYNETARGFLGATLVNFSTQINNKIPAGRFILSFMNTLANIMNQTLDYTPYGYMRANNVSFSQSRSRNNKSDRFAPRYYAEASPEQSAQIARATIGTSVILGLAFLAYKSLEEEEAGGDPYFTVTGAGPSNAMDRQQLIDTKRWKANSIKIGDEWIRYVDIPILGPVFGGLGTVMDSVRYRKDEQTTGEVVQQAAISAVTTVLDKQLLQGANNFFQMIRGGQPGSQVLAARRLVGGVVSGYTNPGLARWLRNTFDADEKGMVDRLDQSNTTGWLMSMVPFSIGYDTPALNTLGEPIQQPWYSATTWRFIESNSGTPHPIITPLIEAGLMLPNPSKITQFRFIDENTGEIVTTRMGKYPEVMRRYTEVRGDLIKRALTPGALEGLARAAKIDLNRAQSLLDQRVGDAARDAAVKIVEKEILDGKLKL